MKSDLDGLMSQAGMDALWAHGHAGDNPAIDYFIGRAHLTSVDIIKKRGETPVLFHGDMERDEAARTGLVTQSRKVSTWQAFMEQARGDSSLASAYLRRKHFADLEIQGRVALYGRFEIGPYLASLEHLRALLPEVEFVAEHPDQAVLRQARITKDPEEIERIRKVGETTLEVVHQVADFLTSHQVRHDALTNGDGQPLTIGQVKSKINLWLAERGAEAPTGTIFAIGHDSAVPHSAGQDEDTLRIGETLIFDIFPRELGGGYHFDFTRTWCLGYAPDEAVAIYEDVLDVYHTVYPEFKAGASAKALQELTCREFEARDHPSLLSDASTQAGFVHGVAHGLGLDVHEPPWFRVDASQGETLKPGMVLTFEPGLYYPERNIGVRIEDTVVTHQGGVETLLDYPKDLVLPMRGGRPGPS